VVDRSIKLLAMAEENKWKPPGEEEEEEEELDEAVSRRTLR